MVRFAIASILLLIISVTAQDRQIRGSRTHSERLLKPIEKTASSSKQPKRKAAPKSFTPKRVAKDVAICDDYDGRARGLCINYCETKDCDTQDHPRCDQIKQDFVSLTGQFRVPCEPTPAPSSSPSAPPSSTPSGPPSSSPSASPRSLSSGSPRLSSKCPCWEEWELDVVTAENLKKNRSCPGQPVPNVIEAKWFNVSSEFENVFGVIAAEASTTYNNPICVTNRFGLEIELTEEEFELCKSQIRNRCAEVGQEITIPPECWYTSSCWQPRRTDPPTTSPSPSSSPTNSPIF